MDRNTRKAVVAIGALMLFLPSEVLADKSPYEWALVRLDYARHEKVQILESFCDRTHAAAQRVVADEVVLACFDINLEYEQAMQKGAVPESLSSRVSALNDRFSRYYIENYLAFYDILFVDAEGHVFHAIRRNAAFHNGHLAGDGAACALAECLKSKPDKETFVDFRSYGTPTEVAAFFVEPIFREGVQKGWVVLQCDVNKLDTLFAWNDSLGQTGETFLVNREGFMLTESNFMGSSSILSKRLDDRNIQTKFAEGEGHRTVTDYRGCLALTSFEVVEFLGTRWLVVAKMDTHEIITQHYCQHRRYFADRLLVHLKNASLPPLQESEMHDVTTDLRVDMDEFLKAEHGEHLHTFGISTCTGLLVSYPGKFAYLAHISPKDKVYGADETNLVGQMVKKVKTFDVYPCDTRRIRFVIVATHLETVQNITDKLVDEGFFLSQIQVLINQDARTAAVCYDYTRDSLHVVWSQGEGLGMNNVHTIADATSLETVVQGIMNVEEESRLSNQGDRGDPIGRSIGERRHRTPQTATAQAVHPSDASAPQQTKDDRDGMRFGRVQKGS